MRKRTRSERWYPLGTIAPLAVAMHRSGLPPVIPAGEQIIVAVAAPGALGSSDGIPTARVAPYVHFGMIRPSRGEFRYGSYHSIPATDLETVDAQIERATRWWAPWTQSIERRLVFKRVGASNIIFDWRQSTDEGFRALMKPAPPPTTSPDERFAQVAKYVTQVISTLHVQVAEALSAFGGPGDSVSPHRFELAVTEQLRRLGAEVRHVGQTGDGGVDVEAKYNGEVLVVQCKRFDRPVGSPAVRDLIGTVYMQKARLGLLVSISGFSDAARQAAVGQPVVLLAAHELAAARSLSDLLPHGEEMPR